MANVLKQSGILGMHWGIRKASQDHIEARALKKKSVKELSNKEITKITTRLSLEKQLKTLNPTEISRGQKLAVELITKFGPMILSALMAKYAKNKYDQWRADPTSVLPLLEGVVQ